MECEDTNHPEMHAKRNSENSDFIISSTDSSILKHGKYHIGTLTANFWGTGFEILDSGFRFPKN